MRSLNVVLVRHVARLVRATSCLVLPAVFAAGWPATAHAQNDRMAAAPGGLIETGAPPFVVLDPAAIGLSAAPTDAHVLPDGRLLFVAPQEIALGDGVRWDVWRQAEEDPRVPQASVAVADDGSIYVGMAGGFGRVRFDPDGRWRLESVATWPASETIDRPVPRTMSAVNGEWFWHSLSGSILAWKPGETTRVFPTSGTIEHVFAFQGATLQSDRADGHLSRLTGTAVEEVIPLRAVTPDDAITCSAPLDAERMLVGTHGSGLRVFDGHETRLLVTEGVMAGEHRINDVCAVGEGTYAAAVDNFGIVFFDREGRTVQYLDRSIDNRLSRVQRLVVVGDTVLWALLNNGVARVEFPSSVSNFEPLIDTGITTARPYRLDGFLWLLADGKVHRGIYSPEGRLERFAVDTPPGRFAFSFSTVIGHPYAGTTDGLYRREATGWRLVGPGIVNAQLIATAPRDGRWLFGARRELFWLRESGDDVVIERFPAAGVEDVYGAVTDARGDAWLELGPGRFGRVRAGNEAPTVDVFGRDQGVGDSWVQVFVLDGVVHFNIADRIARFDEATGRVAINEDFTRRLAGISMVIGRPIRDARGHLWVTDTGGVQVFDDRADPPHNLQRRMPAGLRPNYYTVEDNGVVWMYEPRRLARFDPAIPTRPPSPLRALITQVQLPSSNRTMRPIGGRLPDLAYAENSLVVRFVAPVSPFGEPVSFEVHLAGSDTDWVPAGTGGTAGFNRLKEGDYVLRVRPRRGNVTGEEDALAFTVRPPWFRTTSAYVIYALGSLGCIGLIAWVPSYLQRREKTRLARLVTARTQDLNDANVGLARQIDETRAKAEALHVSEARYRALSESLKVQVAETLRQAGALGESEERYRHLSEKLEQHVAARTAELHQANERLVESNRELEAFSYSVSHDLRAPLRNISGFAELLRKRTGPGLDEESVRFLGIVGNEAVRLGQLIDSLLVFSRLARSELKRQPLDLTVVITAVRHELSAEAADRAVEWRLGPMPQVPADPTLLRQVFANLLSNALKFTRTRAVAVIEVSAHTTDGPTAEHVINVRDNGVGFDPKYTDKLFGVFQRLHSSRDYAGSGIGLATVRRIVARHGGRVWAAGEPGVGATFTFTLPIRPESSDVAPSDAG